MVKVSVIIPNYNRAQVIGETIDNMLRQSLPPHEMIVVDDGSTDNSVEVIRYFGDHVTLIQQPNQGPGVARNAGLKIATGEFIQFMDSDDLASVNKLAVQTRALIKHDADIVYGPWVRAWLADGCMRPENIVLQQRPLPAQQHALHWFLTAWSMVFQQCLVRRSALDRAGSYREDLWLYEDGDLFVRLLLTGATLVHEAESLTFYRLDDYGKLTTSGEHSCKRVLNTARFHALVIQQLCHHPQFSSIVHHAHFQMCVWQSWREVSSVPVPEDAAAYLKALAPYCSDRTLRFQVWLQQKQKGLQQRLRGHRWPACYQPGKITQQQQGLLQEMGLRLT